MIGIKGRWTEFRFSIPLISNLALPYKQGLIARIMHEPRLGYSCQISSFFKKHLYGSSS